MKHTDLGECRRTMELLPWYANGSLDVEERAAVRVHLDRCATCRRECTLLCAVIESMPSPHSAQESGSAFGKLLQRINREEQQRWSWKTAAAILVMLVAVAAVALPVYLLEPRYQAVTDARPHTVETVQARIVFDAQKDIGTLSELLERYNAEVIAGPDSSRRFLLEFPLAPGDTVQQLKHQLEQEAQVLAVDMQQSR